MSTALERALLRYNDLPTGDLRAQLGWLEEAAQAAAEADVGEAGARAALDLRAALGAFVAYAQSPRAASDRVGLELTVKALLGRALGTLYGSFAASYRELAKVGPKAQECRELAKLFADLERSIAQGKPASAATLRRLAELQSTVEG